MEESGDWQNLHPLLFHTGSPVKVKRTNRVRETASLRRRVKADATVNKVKPIPMGTSDRRSNTPYSTGLIPQDTTFSTIKIHHNT